MFTIQRDPTSPGEILDEEFLKPLYLTQKQFAHHLGCNVKVINRIVHNRTSILNKEDQGGSAFKKQVHEGSRGPPEGVPEVLQKPLTGQRGTNLQHPLGPGL